MKANYFISVLLLLCPMLSLAAALANQLAKRAEHSFIPPSIPSIGLSDCLSGLREKSCETWQGMPLWGKTLTVGATTGAVLFGIYAMKSKHAAPKINSEEVDDANFQKLKTLLREAPNSGKRILANYASDEQKSAVFFSVVYDIISEPYTEKEKEIIAIATEQKVFSPYDWFLLWKYACEHEHNKDTVLRNWIAENWVTELYVQRGDQETVKLAIESGVAESVPVYYDSEDESADN